MTNERQQFGSTGERLVATYLQDRGFRILERNYRTPLGEIDLIAAKGGAIHFVEVKARRSHAAGDPFEQVTPHKQRQIIRAALAYCARRRLINPEIHFDVVSVDHSTPTVTIDHLIDAFGAEDATFP